MYPSSAEYHTESDRGWVILQHRDRNENVSEDMVSLSMARQPVDPVFRKILRRKLVYPGHGVSGEGWIGALKAMGTPWKIPADEAFSVLLSGPIRYGDQ